MAKEVVLLAVHGMGRTREDFAEELLEKLAKTIGPPGWEKVHVETVFYQSVLQANEDRVFREMHRRAEIDWISLRKFILFGFSDAAGLERSAWKPGSPYEKAQKIILESLDRAHEATGRPLPVIIVAHSLGCQVMSNYIWDAQQTREVRQGVWRPGGAAGDGDRRSAHDRFRRLKTMRFLYTTGCNIPVFVAGFPRDDIKAVKTRTGGYDFVWKNFYDEDDVLGWPLKPLSPSYRDAVKRDHAVNAGQGLLGLLKSWNPLSHNEYWTDSEVIGPLARDLKKLATASGG